MILSEGEKMVLVACAVFDCIFQYEQNLNYLRKWNLIFKSNNVPEIIDTKSYNLLFDGYTATYNIKGPEKNSYYTIYLNAFDDTHKYTFMVHILKNGREKILMNEGKSFMYKDSIGEQYQTFQSKIGTLELTYGIC